MKWVGDRETERLLADCSKLSGHTGQQGLRVDYSVKMPGTTWLFFCYPAGCGVVWEWGVRGKRERERKERKSYIYGLLVIVLQRNPLVILPEKRTNYFYSALA